MKSVNIRNNKKPSPSIGPVAQEGGFASYIRFSPEIWLQGFLSTTMLHGASPDEAAGACGSVAVYYRISFSVFLQGRNTRSFFTRNIVPAGDSRCQSIPKVLSLLHSTFSGIQE